MKKQSNYHTDTTMSTSISIITEVINIFIIDIHRQYTYQKYQPDLFHDWDQKVVDGVWLCLSHYDRNVDAVDTMKSNVVDYD